MKRFFKIIFATTLFCICLFPTACAQKSECDTTAAEDTVTKQEHLPEHRPERLPARPPKCPEIPKEPDDSQEKNKEDETEEGEHRRVRPLPIRRDVSKKLLPFEIFIEDDDEGEIIYIVFPHKN